MTPTTYTYKETMKIVERFMENTYIRQFCTDYCKGRCCSSNCEKRCTKTKRRRISCSIFVCSELLPLVFPEQWDRNIFFAVESKILFALNNVEHYDNEYFVPHSQQVRAKFKVSRKVLDTLKNINVWNIARRVYRIENFARRYVSVQGKEK